MIYLLFFLNVLLLGYIVWKEIQFNKERADLILHIRSKDLSDYEFARKNLTATPPIQQEEKEEINVGELEPDAFQSAVNKELNNR